MKITDATNFLGLTDKKKKRATEPEQARFDRGELGPRKVILAWEDLPKTTPTAIDPRYKKTLMITGGLVAFLFFLMQEFLLIIVIASIYFFSYVVSKNPLDKFKYEISTHGISVNGRLYYWDEMLRFFFSSHYGEEHLAVDLKEGLSSRLIIAFKPSDKDKIIEALNKYLSYLEEEPLTFLDKAYTYVVDKFDLEKKK